MGKLQLSMCCIAIQCLLHLAEGSSSIGEVHPVMLLYAETATVVWMTNYVAAAQKYAACCAITT